MYILPIIGISNSGKTTAIKYTMKHLIELEESQVVYVSFKKLHNNDDTYDKEELIKLIDYSIDKGVTSDRNIGCIVVKYKDKTIGLTSYGDSLDVIKKNFNDAILAANNKLDLFVCARHCNNDIYREFENFGMDVSIELTDHVCSRRTFEDDKEAWLRDNEEKGRLIFEQIKSSLFAE